MEPRSTVPPVLAVSRASDDNDGDNSSPAVEAAAAATYLLLFLLVSPVTTVVLGFVLVYSTYFWWLPLVYLAWVYSDWDTAEKGGRLPWSWWVILYVEPKLRKSK